MVQVIIQLFCYVMTGNHSFHLFRRSVAEIYRIFVMNLYEDSFFIINLLPKRLGDLKVAAKYPEAVLDVVRMRKTRKTA